MSRVRAIFSRIVGRDRSGIFPRAYDVGIPLPAELFSGEQLQRHARMLAGRHRLDPRHGPDRLLAQLAENEQILVQTRDLVTAAEARGLRVSSAGEWLLDNYYRIEQQIRLTRLHLPKTYSRELPRLMTGPTAGFPRVYDIALELIAHVDGRVDAANVSGFVDAYQSIAPLTLGELWAVPIMLRLGLIENLRRVAADIARRRRHQDLANRWADRLLAAAEKGPKDVLQVLAAMAQADPAFTNPFVEEFSLRLQGQGAALAIVQSWVEHRLAEQGLTREQLQRADSQVQAASEVSIGNSLGSLRFLIEMDWREFVETLSVVELALRSDPAGVYGAMDFATRDRYRHRIEALARRVKLAETDVARTVVRLAAEAAHRDGTQARTAHVGFYLIDKGRPHLEGLLHVPRSLRGIAGRAARRSPLAWYLGPVLLLTAAATLLLGVILPFGMDDWRFWPSALLGMIAASQAALAVVNMLVNVLVPPHALPRLDFSKAIPSDHRTMVVIPTLLTGAQAITELLEGLEIRYLGNRDQNLWFALLTDFHDAPLAVQPDDAALLKMTRDGITALNRKYETEGRTVFFLFHRPRVWNPYERLWMGYERKRGKLEQFNALLRGGPRESFSEIVGDPAILPSIKYVITLDTDTALPRDAARRLVGTMAHLLNRPRIDPKTLRVVEGYAILQPRTPISLLAAGRSRFARLSAGDAGIDPYTREVSDVYQDVFAEGSYVGKGIYDVDAFRRSTEGRFPQNLILSHDLVESGFARSALVTDVELYEDHPASFAIEMSRRHRWIRGDWQIAGWLLPWVPVPAGKRRPNTLPALARWKIFDNLRRSLVPPAQVLLLLGGWTLAPEPAGLWTLIVIALLVGPLPCAALLELVRKPRGRPWVAHLDATARSLGRELAHAGLALATLPYRAVVNLHAILVSGVRMLFTRRGLLAWHTPGYAKRNAAATLAGYVRETWIAPLCGAAGLALLALGRPAELAFSGPVLASWLLAPFVGWWISRPLVAAAPVLSERQWTFLGALARRTWRYFEVLVNAEHHGLPPDNYQEDLEPAVASRTSPTNLGLALLANLAAHDFGYLPVGRLLERIQDTLAAMETLERYRGHFYNWYDTHTMQPMRPFYVSSVDSGNLVGALFTLRAGLEELKHQPLVSDHLWAGLADTLHVVRDHARGFPALLTGVQRAHTILDAPCDATVDAIAARLRAILEQAADIVQAVPSDASSELSWWAGALERQCRDGLEDVQGLVAGPERSGPVPTLQQAARSAEHGGRAAGLLRRIDDLVQRCAELAEMDFSFLYDSACDLLSVGYDVGDRRRDLSYYDQLASESRLASFLLIAQGQVPQEHWFALGRQLTAHDGALALLSWSGSMFEYLMPLLLMPTHEHTLLDETYRAIVARQIAYGRERGVPWGISESCYNATDAGGAYQYRAFGVPGLGFKRGLADDLVVAPYASALALMVEPPAACQNLERLASDGYLGAFGLYEAIDFTPTRLPRGATRVPLRSFMAHHQGMSLLALASLLLNRPMQRRFLSDPLVKATELLLQERVPRVAASSQPHAAEVTAARKPPLRSETAMRVFPSPHTRIPEVHLLSNGRYHVMVTNAGGGYSRWNDLAVTRWREDATCDGWGLFCYLRDATTGALWSAAYQPTQRPSKRFEAIFVQGRAEFRRRDDDIDSHTEIAVSPEDDVEVRRVTLVNLSARVRTIELTSYTEVVLAPLTADLAHPAFSNLFVHTEILAERNAILCTRRPREPEERPPWLFHLLTAQGTPAGEASYETDRARFVGRGRTVARPAAFDGVVPLSNSEGSVLDPIVAIRQGVVIQPDTSANFHVISGIAGTREAALALVGKYRDPSFAARAFGMAWSHSQVVLRQLQATEAEAQVYDELAASVLHANPLRRAGAGVLTRNRRGQSGLWGFGISGDLPIVLMRIADVNRIDLVRQILKAHAYWRAKGLEVDLVILNEDFSGYRQIVNDRIMGLIAAGPDAHRVDKPGGIFVRRSEQLSEEDRVLLQTVARAIVTDSAETLAEQVERRPPIESRIPPFEPTRHPYERRTTPFERRLPFDRRTAPFEWRLPSADRSPAPPARELVFFNGLGGFTPDGREYVVTLAPGQATPAPWANVLANERIGTVVSESGGAYTWAQNAHEFRLTTWHNDPVGDASGEAFYLRDEETGQFWSPTALPARGPGTYVCRHGFGYSVFEHEQFGIGSELWTYVALDAPVKLCVVKLRNRSGRSRRLSVTGYWEWVLGQWRHANLMHVVTEIDPNTGAVFARNVYNREFAGAAAFVGTSEPARTLTCSRAEFLGRNGTLADPAALHRAYLSGRTGAGLDPCAAVQVPLEVPDGQEREVVFVLGAGQNTEEAQELVRRFSGSAGAHQALEQVWEYWKQTLGVVHAETPDGALNILVNGWLEYQVLACRYWGRSGYYQSGGAYGFRDQLQDTAALIHAAPWAAREHLLRSAGRQFREGDVQHWWHPPSGRGVRTHCSDDFLWLPYAACRYVTATGDTGVWEERVPFLEGRPVNPDEESYYDLPQRSGEEGTLYEHCVRAIGRGLRFGVHGLPLIGSGDWNDGMNLVGRQGRGESVWLAFFLHHVLRRFGEQALRRGDEEFARRCREEAERLRGSIEEHAWDGAWYRRAYFDDGTPLGSAASDECRIDSLSQSWAVLSGAADPGRARQAMESVEQKLVRRDERLIRLFDPPFDTSALEPGYIKGYVPGVRENGGQYTHAAIWAVMAFAEMGDVERAWELFSLINPINHAGTPEAVGVYKVEPYVMAADVYAVPPHTGRGGWTWYTGSAGWMYRMIVETLLGLRIEGDRLLLGPRVPRAWDTFRIHYRHRGTFYHLTVSRAGPEATTVSVTVDGAAQPDAAIPLVDDHREHDVEVLVPASP
jgi:cyclic beta-1,2-glucan synthetase